MNVAQQVGAVMVVFGGVAWRWGKTRSVVLDDRGPGWELAYRIAMRGGPVVSLFGVMVAGGGTVAQ